MIVSRRALPRRTFLRGAGAALALPLLDSMIPAMTPLVKAAANPRRLGFFYVPNGHIDDARWTPATEGAGFELTQILGSLAPVYDQTIVVTGLAHKTGLALGDGNGDHSRATPTWLSGVHPKKTEAGDVRGGMTADQIAAAALGKETPLASLELGLDGDQGIAGACENGYSCIYTNTISWRTDTQALPAESNPGVVFERMFGDGGSTAQRRVQMRNNESILDSVTGELARLGRTLGPADRATVNEYTEAVRDVEQRIQRAERTAGTTAPPDRPFGIPLTFQEHLTLMFDLQILAYQADITPVVSFLMSREVSSRSYPECGVPIAHHSASHHGNRPEVMAQFAKINAYHVSLFSKFIQKLHATPDGDGSLLDHSLILYGSGLGDGNGHTHFNLPTLLFGGANGFKGGRHLRYPEGTPMTNLLVSMLNKVDVRIDRLGDSTGPLPGL
jgi:Protein of unknown function (DUF1552)